MPAGRLGYRWSLRNTPAAALLLAGLSLSGWSYLVELRDQTRHAEMEAQDALIERLTNLQGTLEFLLANRALEQVRQEIVSLYNRRGMRTALLTDEHDIVIAAGLPERIGLPLGDVTAITQASVDRAGLAAAEYARSRMAGRVWTSPDRLTLTAVYPVMLGAGAGEIGVSRIGLLVVQQDLAHTVAAARIHAGNRAFGLAAGIVVFVAVLATLLHWQVTRRVQHLVAAIHRFARGERQVRARLGGGDELAKIGRALDHMAEQTESRIADLQRTEELLRLEREVLESIAVGLPLARVLAQLCLLVERAVPQSRCFVMLLDAAQTRLSIAAAPNFPRALADRLDGLLPGRGAGSCGTAAYLGRPVFVSDTCHDPLWTDFQHIVEEFNLRACWSHPIADAGHALLGTFAISHTAPGLPELAQRELLKAAAQLAGIALQRQATQAALLKSEEQYRSVVASLAEGIVVIGADQSIQHCNAAAGKMVGMTVQQIIGQVASDPRWSSIREDGSEFPPDERPFLVTLRTGMPCEGVVEGVRRSDGELSWLSVNTQPLIRPGETKPHAVVCSFTDITVARQNEAQLAFRHRVLEMAATGESYRTILEHLVRHVEANVPGGLCSILLMDMSGTHLLHGAGPSLPEEYNRAIDGIAIGPEVGSCGTAAFRAEPVNVTDIDTDPLWAGYRTLALKYGLRACWSTPFSGEGGRVLGTFAVYYREPRAPAAAERRIVDQIASLAGVVVQRYRAQEALRQSEERYRSLIASLAEGIIMQDAGGRIVACNAAAERILGRGREEISGRTPMDLHWQATHEDGSPFPGDTHPGMVTLQTGAPRYDVVMGLRRPDGQLIWVSINSQPMVHPGERRPYAVVCSFADITARRKSDESLRVFEQMTATVNEFMSFVDTTYTYRAVNRYYLDFFGRREEEIVGHPIAALHGREQFETIIKPDFDRTLAGETTTTSISADHPQLGRRCIESILTPHRDSKGAVTGVIVSSRDVTERKRAAAALAESERRYRLVIEASHDTVWDWDIVTDALIWSDNVHLFQGYRREELGLTGAWFRERVHPGDINGFDDGRRRALEENHDTWEGEFRFRRADGTYAWLHDRSKILRDQTGRAVRMVGATADITKRKLAEQELQRYREQLEEMVCLRTAELRDTNAELEAFAYSISHDLRAPLRGIDGFSQALLEDYGERLDPTGISYIERVRRAAQRLRDLLDSLMQLSRVTRRPMQEVTVDLSVTGTEVADELRYSDPNRDARFTIAGGCEVLGDPHLLRILMENLLGNAWKYTGKTARAAIQFGRLDGTGVFYVKDNGAGFDPDYAHKLFAPFQRLHDPGDFEGSGIGLATAQRIVRRHGGRIWAHGTPGSGAAFYFTLWERRPSVVPHAATLTAAPPDP